MLLVLREHCSKYLGLPTSSSFVQVTPLPHNSVMDIETKEKHMRGIVRPMVLVPLAVVAAITVAVCALMNPAAAVAAPQSADVVSEILSLRTENSQTYQLANGQYRCDVYANDVFYRDESGKLVAIDNTLTEAVAGPGYRFTNIANQWHASFASTLGDATAIKLDKDGATLTFGLLEAKSTAVVSRAGVLAQSQLDVDQEVATDGRAVVYRDVLEGVDVAYTVLTSALKEDLILRDKTAPSTFTFALTLENLKPLVDGGNISFVDSTGKEVLSVLPAYMDDARGKHSEKVTYSLERTSTGYNLIVSADPSFLSAPDTVYPVVIDPSFDTTGSAYTFDTWISEEYPDTHYYLSTYLRTGNDGPSSYGIRRSYVRFRVPSGIKVGTSGAWGLTSAQLKLRYYTKSGTQTLRAHQITGSSNYWISSDVTYNDHPAYSTSQTAPAVPSGSWYVMDVTTQMRNCYQLINWNQGWCIKDDVEYNPAVWGTFYSSDYGTAGYLPVLSITYTGLTNHFAFDAKWPSAIADDLRVAVVNVDDAENDPVDPFFQAEVNASYQRWNGIVSAYNIDSIARYTYFGSGREIEISASSYDSGIVALTALICSGFPDWTGDIEQAGINLNTNSASANKTIPYDDFREEVIVHELGHCAGLDEVAPSGWSIGWNSLCVMSSHIFYGYPYPTSHDRDSLDAKY